MSKENLQAFIDEVTALREKHDVDLFCIAGNDESCAACLHGEGSELGSAIVEALNQNAEVRMFFLTIADIVRESANPSSDENTEENE